MTATQNFYNNYRQAALNAASGTKIFPETILAVASLESNNGQSLLSAKYNNFFGIKNSGTWSGKTVTLPTKEQDTAGNVYTVDASFRWYDSPTDSFKNYVQFISGPRYVTAGVLSATTPQEQFDALHKAGYATDVSYVQKLEDRLAEFGEFIESNPTTSGIAVVAIFFLIYKILS